jgi:hypothetical protein
MAQNAATGTAGHAEWAPTLDMGRRLLAATARRVQGLLNGMCPGAFDSYRPELHYMRGPGPKWREKHGMTARNRRG